MESTEFEGLTAPYGPLCEKEIAWHFIALGALRRISLLVVPH